MPKILLLECSKAYADPLEIALKKFDTKITRVRTNEALSKFEKELSRCDGVAVSGTDFSPGTDRTKNMTPVLRDQQLSIPFLRWAIKKKKPLLGICHGFQMLVALFGGVLERKINPQEGIFETRVICEDPLFRGLPDQFKAYKWRRWYVKKAPVDFIPLAVSTESIDAVRHIKLPFYGIQFHPEIKKSDNQCSLVFKNWLEGLKKL